MGSRTITRSIKSHLKARFPVAWQRMRTVKAGLALAPRLFGYEPRVCNLCGFHGRFLAEIHFPDIFTYDALCPQCGALPRNRLLALAVEQRAPLTAVDRLRRFGRSVRNDFIAAGFAHEDFTADGATTVRHGLIAGETLFIGRKVVDEVRWPGA